MNISVRANQRVKKSGLAQGINLRGLLAMLALATATGLVFAYCTVRATNLSYQVSEARMMQRELKEVARRLTVELNHLKSPARLEREGSRLGLAPPGPDRVRRLP